MRTSSRRGSVTAGLFLGSLVAPWALGASAAQAQSSGCSVVTCNEGLLGNFGSLATTPAGMAILDQNLAAVENIYLSSTPEQKLTAALDSQLQPLVPYYNIWNHAVPQLSNMFNAGNLLATGSNFPSTSGTYYSTTYNATGAFGSIAGSMKTFFANLSQPTYNAAYTILPEYVDQKPKDPRPFVVSEQINGNPWTTSQTSQLAVTIQQSANVPVGFAAQYWGEYVTSPGFPSGHTTIGTTLALLTGIMAPEYYKDFLMAGIEFGLSRNIFGVHHTLDVIGGRLIATYNIAQWLNGVSYADVGLATPNLAAATADLQAYIGSGGSSPYAGACQGNVIGCIRAGTIPTAAEFAQDRAAYTWFLTYGLPDLTATTEAPVVPLGAEVLISTRFPYLSAEQRREVLATTELPSGNVFDNGAGWARLNLFVAADGFGALNCGGEGAVGCIQTVTMNSALGGYNAFDVWANDMTGHGGLALAGDGTLILAGNSSYTGGTRVAGGMLAITGSIVGALDIEPVGAVYNAGNISAAGGSTVRNDGALINDGVIASSVASTGLFANNGSVTGSLASTGILFGTGEIGGKLAVTGGIVAPGNSIGTITVGGDLHLGAHATYQAEIDGSGESDRIVAGGAGVIDGAALQVAFADGAIIGLRNFEVVSAAGGITGAFGSINDPFGSAYPFLDLGLAYGATGVTVETTRSAVPFTLFAATPNQIAVAAALDTAALTNGRFDDAVLSLNGATAPAAFSALSPEINASAKSVFVTDSRFLRRAVIDRLRSADIPAERNEMSVAPLFYAAPTKAASPIAVKATPAAPVPTTVLWARGFGAWSSVEGNGNGNASELDSTVGGAFIGADTQFDAWRLGVLGGYSSTSFDVDARASSGNSDGWHAGLYAGRDWDALSLRTGLAYSWQSVDTTRAVAFNDYADTLKADYDTGLFQIFGELAYGIETGLVRFEPFANLSYVSLHTDGYTEQGAGAALVNPGSTTETSFTTLGLRATLPFALGGTSAALSGTIGWQHAFGDIDPTATAYFATGSAPFTVSGLPIAEDAALVEVGLSMALTEAASLSVAYSGQFGDGTTQNSINAAIKLSF